jgi:FG-GAP-like repeat
MPVPVFARTRHRRPQDSVRALNTGRGRQSHFRGLSPVFYAATLSRIPSDLLYLQVAHRGEVIQVFSASGRGGGRVARRAVPIVGCSRCLACLVVRSRTCPRGRWRAGRLRTISDRTARLLAGLVVTAGLADCPRGAPTACSIGDTIYSGGTVNPLDPCEVCRPGVNSLAWSPLIGVDCDGGWSFPDGGDDAGLVDAGDAGPRLPDAGPDAGSTDAGVDAGAGLDAGPSPDGGPCPCCSGDAGVPGPSCVPGPASDLRQRSLPPTSSQDSYFQIVSADFDGDGILDVAGVVSYGRGYGVDVFFGKADGTLSAPPAYYDGSDGNALAAGDVNGDGFPDLVATNWLGPPGGVNVFLNQGDGTFAPPVLYPSSGCISSIGIGDINGDGAPDLVLGEPCGGVDAGSEVLLNDGKGAFGVSVALPQAQGRIGGGIVVVDLNKDGLADIAINGAFQSASALAVLLSQRDGGFELTTFPLVPSGSDAPLGGGIAVLDSRRDGAPDLVTASLAGFQLTVFRNRGDGHFDADAPYSSGGPSLGWIAAGDFNGDCTPDIAGAGFAYEDAGPFGTVVVFSGLPDGGFTPPTTLLREMYEHPSGVALLGPACSARNLGVADLYTHGIIVFGTAR